MKEDALSCVLLVKAVEETDRTGEILPLADREHATRAVLRERGASAVPDDAAAERAMQALGVRAERLLSPLVERHPVLREIRERSHVPGWLRAVLLAAAFGIGIALGSLDGTRRVDLLAFPFLGVIAWNLLVYAVVVAGWVRGAVRRGRSARAVPVWVRHAVARRLARLVRRTARVDAKLGEVVARYAADWGSAGGALLTARLGRLLHVGAAIVALGLICGVYLRGIVFRYQAGWESTFLEPDSVRTLLGIVFGPASAISGIVLPQTAAETAALQWTTGGGGDAAPWIHLIALTLGLFVVAPRLLLAAIAHLEAWQWGRSRALPEGLLDYARWTLGAAHASRGSGIVIVAPYACELSATARSGLQRWLEAKFGRGAAMDLRATSPYGGEDALTSLLHAEGARSAEGLVLLLALAATPEAENHGQAIMALRDAVRRERSPPELHVLVDESGYVGRMGGDVALASRLEERRALWRRFVRGYGLEAELVDLSVAR